MDPMTEEQGQQIIALLQLLQSGQQVTNQWLPCLCVGIGFMVFALMLIALTRWKN